MVNVATPLDSATVPPVLTDAAPEMLAVIKPVAVVTVFPLSSVTASTGCSTRAVPLTAVVEGV